MGKLTKEIASRMLGDVPEDKRFWCNDGRVLKNLRELETALKEMSDETFHYHVTEAKNDFTNWVKDVIGDEDLAKDLRRSTVKSVAVKKVIDRIAALKRVR